MEKVVLKSILEALIFASEEPIGLAALTGVLEEKGVTKNEIQSALQEMMQEYNEGDGRGLLLREVGGAYQFVTKPSLAELVQKLDVAKPKTLSQPALETLAIVAYRQPLVRSEIEQIRGVDSGGVLKTLLERGLIKIVGRKEEAGQPLIYGTTPAFLELFHLANLEELPSMKEVEQIVEESQRVKALPEETGVEEMERMEEPQERETAVFDASLPQEEEALVELETSLKGLRQLEKEIFPKEAKGEEDKQTPAEETPPNSEEFSAKS